MKAIKPLNKFWNRSPIFYKIRNRILFKNINLNELNGLSYNKHNSVKTIPKIYFEINEKIFQNKAKSSSDFDKAIHIATWLRKNIKGGRGLGISSDQALKYMLSGSYGICSDFCQIFNNFCVINNIEVREWGLQSNVKDNEGHSFNEFYSSELKKWILIDIGYSIYFASKKAKDNPLSATELFSLKEPEEKIIINITGFKVKANTIRKYYYSGNMQPFVVDKYKNNFYDKLLKTFDFLPIPIIHGLAIILGKSYNYKKIKI